jgi:type VI protein secretion system component VasK
VRRSLADFLIERKTFVRCPIFPSPLERVALRDGWIIYAIFGVLVCLLLWRVATQWKVRSAEAQNLRVSVVIFGVVALVLVVWQGVRQASPIAAHSQDKTITVFAAASMENALDEVDAPSPSKPVSRSSLVMMRVRR